MVTLTFSQISEIVFGTFFLWVGIYLLSKNPYIKLSWVVFGFLACIGFSLLTDPILANARTLEEYIVWQNLTDWPLFFSPVFCYHASLLIKRSKSKTGSFLLGLGYILAAVFYVLDFKGGFILRENVIRWVDYRRFDGFAPGILLIPAVVFTALYFALSIGNFIKEIKEGFWKHFFPILAGIIFLMTGAMTIAAYYVMIGDADTFFNIGFSGATLLFIFSIIKYHLFSPAEKIIFDRNFLYRTIGIAVIILLYLLAFVFSNNYFDFPILVLFTLILMLVIISHSFYDWIITFTNDFLYNFSSGLSVVNDIEMSQVLRHFHDPEKLENSTLNKLGIVEKVYSKPSIDVLREKVKEAMEYFKPETDPHKRIKSNLKYHLLKMIVFDQAEEGQILWELGFDEYPVRIMSKENQLRQPLFKISSPSDYSYTSRNAFIALKKEAIHNVAWRLSYLEKISKKTRR